MKKEINEKNRNNSCIGGVHWWDMYHFPTFSFR